MFFLRSRCEDEVEGLLEVLSFCFFRLYCSSNFFSYIMFGMNMFIYIYTYICAFIHIYIYSYDFMIRMSKLLSWDMYCKLLANNLKLIVFPGYLLR